MKQHHQSCVAISLFMAIGVTMASAAAFAADGGKVNAGGRSASEVQGRASGPTSGAADHAVRAAGLQPASEVFGRGSQSARGTGASIGIGATDVGDFGRSSMTLAKAKSKDASELTVAAK